MGSPVGTVGWMRRERAFSRLDFERVSGVSRETSERLRAYADLLSRWQERINLVSKTSLADLWRRHMLDSAQLFQLMPEGPIRHIDLGSGAGFPGLVMAILAKHEAGLAVTTELVESDQRKCAFLREAARATETSVEIRPHRIEAIAPMPHDLVTARALAPLPRLLNFAGPLMDSASIALFPKGRGVQSEIRAAQQDWRFRHRAVPSQSGEDGVVLCIEDLERVQCSRESDQ